LSKRKRVWETIQHEEHPFALGLLTEDDLVVLSWLIRKTAELARKRSGNREANPNPDNEDVHARRPGNEANDDERPPRPVINQPLDIQVGFLMETVYKHFGWIARLLDKLTEIYPDLNANLGKDLDAWIRELDRDNRVGYGFSILAGSDEGTG